MNKHLLLILLTFFLSSCVTSAFGLDPYTNLNDEERVNISLSNLELDELEKCIHTNWVTKQPKFPLTVTYNQNGKVLAFIGILNSRFFAIEITSAESKEYATMMRTSITSDPTVSLKNSIIRRDLIEVLNKCGTKTKWTTLL